MSPPRPAWGEKSRISAGVATSTTPSSVPWNRVSAAHTQPLGELGTARSVRRLSTVSPAMMVHTRPIRSVSPANQAPATPTKLPTAAVHKRKWNGMWSYDIRRITTDAPQPTR